MDDKKAPQVIKEQPVVKEAKGPSAGELLIQAALLLEKQQEPRANKYYRNLAIVVRQVAARAAI